MAEMEETDNDISEDMTLKKILKIEGSSTFISAYIACLLHQTGKKKQGVNIETSSHAVSLANMN